MAQAATDKKSNELTAIPKLLDLLDLTGAVVSIDTAGCQKTIAEKIVAKGGDDVLAQVAAEEKSNEITAIPKLLELLDLGAAVVIADAAGCQKNVCGRIVEKGGGSSSA